MITKSLKKQIQANIMLYHKTPHMLSVAWQRVIQDVIAGYDERMKLFVLLKYKKEKNAWYIKKRLWVDRTMVFKYNNRVINDVLLLAVNDDLINLREERC